MQQTSAVRGFEIIPAIIDSQCCDALLAVIGAESNRAGDRTILSFKEIETLARELLKHPLLEKHLPSNAVAVQCTLFDKSADTNWLVALHQDLSIPVAERVDDSLCSGWSKKDGVHYTQPPIDVLRSLIAVRVHLDDCDSDNGPLRVVPGSHLHGRWTAAEIETARATFNEVECQVPRGGALMMSPLLLHASSKSKHAAHRRVLHFLFGPCELPCGLRWHQSV